MKEEGRSREGREGEDHAHRFVRRAAAPMMSYRGSAYYRGSGFRIFPSHIGAALNSSQLSEISFFSPLLQFDTSLVKGPVPKMAKDTAKMRLHF